MTKKLEDDTEECSETAKIKRNKTLNLGKAEYGIGNVQGIGLCDEHQRPTVKHAKCSTTSDECKKVYENVKISEKSCKICCLVGVSFEAREK